VTRSLTIRWDTTPGDPPRVTYYVDDTPVGEDDVGFDRILDLVRAEDDTRVTLHIRSSPSLGGGPLADALPFRDRLDELQAAVGEHAVAYDFG
jgi:hypothetical protein